MGEDFAYGFTPGAPDVSRPWLHDRHHPLLGRHLPWNRVSDWPALSVEPGYAMNKTHPTHFKAYTRTKDGEVWADVGPSWEEAKYNLRVRVEGAGW